MVSTAAVIGIGTIALGMVLTPGPNMIYLASRSIVQGRQAGLISLGGVIAGFVVYLALVAVGVAAVLAIVPWLYTAIKLAGAAYLLWLAWSALRPGGHSAFEPRVLPPDSRRKLFTMGLVTNLLNPKIAILYMSLLPQFVDPARGHIIEQTMILGLTQIVVAGTVNALIVLFASSISLFLKHRPTWLRIQRYLMGTVLAALAVRVAVAE
ncbi:LysE family translocator [Solwaraspora sp. WMMD406]|uniref:LysE family translocator n=1 Tax=Solwaraspora sp. WMMD406 TaxID=3016095 RepID=UPI002416DCA6|nr:LysE family translocator [Solwaraspora sp. WMMD406]MDG4767447.1 LysE family translocator [Solwaraspora sp. WMMD406]